MSPIRSPSQMVKETFSKSGFAPKDFEIPCALIIGGNDLQSPEGSYLRLSGTADGTLHTCEGACRISHFRKTYFASFIIVSMSATLICRAGFFGRVARTECGLRIQELRPGCSSGRVQYCRCRRREDTDLIHVTSKSGIAQPL